VPGRSARRDKPLTHRPSFRPDVADSEGGWDGGDESSEPVARGYGPHFDIDSGTGCRRPSRTSPGLAGWVPARANSRYPGAVRIEHVSRAPAFRQLAIQWLATQMCADHGERHTTWSRARRQCSSRPTPVRRSVRSGRFGERGSNQRDAERQTIRFETRLGSRARRGPSGSRSSL
jgi:hypothetical protein